MTADGTPTPLPTGHSGQLAAPGAAPAPMRLVLDGSGLARRCSWSARSWRDQPLSRDAPASRRGLPSTVTKASVHSELVHPARSTNLYPLCGRLFCRCGTPFCRWGSPEAKRKYMSVCGCRLRPIDADTIERRVYVDLARLDPASAAGYSPEKAAEVLARLYTRIEVGGTVDDVSFVPRT